METKARRTALLIAAAVILVVVIVAGAGIYLNQIAPFRIPVVTVDGSTVNMRTFLIRTHMSGRQPLEMLEILAREEIVKQVAPLPPFNIVVSDKDIDRYFRDMARGTSKTIDEKEFGEWYRQQLNASRLSDRELRDLARTQLLTRRLEEALAAKVPTIAEQVHLHMIPVKGFDAARAVKARLDGGADFARLARELSVDQGLKASGGDAGWQPRGVLPREIAQAAFDDLGVGEVSGPLFINEDTYAVVMVSERAAARRLDEAARRGLQDRALDDWLTSEEKRHRIGFHGLKGDSYDSETDAWVRWQLARLKQEDKTAGS